LFSDRFFYPNAVQMGDSLLDGRAYLYRIVEILAPAAPGSVDVRVVPASGANGAPVGRGAVFDGLPAGLLPPLPTNTGQAAPSTASRIALENIVLIGRSLARTTIEATNQQDAANQGITRNQAFRAADPNTMGEQPGTIIICTTCPTGN
jgi:hypothetical protein